MTARLLKYATGCAVAVSMLVLPVTAEESSEFDPFNVLMGGGLVMSPGYPDFIDDAYSLYNEDSGIGWLDLYAGMEFRPDELFSIILACDVWFNSVDVVGGPLDETYANIILIPSLYGQLYLDDAAMFYINAGVNLPIPDTGSDRFKFKNDGLGLGVNIGVQLAEVFRIEAGYVHVPVTAEPTASNPTSFIKDDYDFGGAQIRAMLAF